MLKKEERKIRSEKVIYPDNNEVVYIKRVTRQNLQDLWDLQVRLLELYAQNNLAFASLIMSDEGYSIMNSMCDLIPIVGKEGETLDFSRLEEDYEQLERLFCTSSMQDNGVASAFDPSIICSLHHFDYQVLGKFVRQYITEQDKQTSGQATSTQTS